MLAQNIDELQCILGELFFSFKEKIDGREDMSTNSFTSALAKRTVRNNDDDDDL